MSQPPFLPYAKQSIQEEDRQAVSAALNEELITRGPLVKHFEESIAAYCNVPYAVAFNSGSSALAAAYFAARINDFDRVITSPNTFIATLGAAIQQGARPFFVDVDRDTGNLDLAKLAEVLRFQSTRGRPFIVPVHFSGIPVDMSALDRLIHHPEAIVIEDAAHALGSIYPSGEKVGSCAYSQMTVFSFHPAKTITTGEGGMVMTRDEELFHRLQLFRDNGIERNEPYLSRPSALGYYEAQAITGNFHLTSFQAALGVSQFRRLDAFVSKRRTLVNRYRQNLGHVSQIKLFSQSHFENTAFHLFVVQIDFAACKIGRQEVMRQLKMKGIGSQVHYIPLYYHPIIKSDEELEKGKCPEMGVYYSQALTLPLYFDLQEEDVDRICKDLLSILKI